MGRRDSGTDQYVLRQRTKTAQQKNVMVTTKFTGADAEKQPVKAWEMQVDAHDEL